MREKYRKSIASLNKFSQFTTMNVIDGQAGLKIYSSLIFYSLTIDNILNIIVLLILVGVTIATLTGENGLLTKTHESEFKTDIATFQEELRISIAEDYLEKQGQRVDSDKFNAKGYDNIIKIIPSFKKKYEKKLEVKEDELVYIALDELERKWMSEMEIELAKKLTINYVDTQGNKLAEPYITAVPNKKYSVVSPEIAGYMPMKDIIEGELTEDTELTVEYYAICNDLAFIGLDSNGNETEDEAGIASYTVSGIGNCNNPKVAIPKEYNGKSVTQIKANAFSSNSTIQGLVIPSTIEEVGAEAFYGSTGLKEVNINSKNISYIMFCGCTNLEKVIIGKNVESIAERAFDRCAKIIQLTYLGTIEEWNNIVKGKTWKQNTGIEKIVCSDGTITL